MTSRANPFAGLDEFTPKQQTQTETVPVAVIEQISEEAGFLSRKARSKPTEDKGLKPQKQIRRYTTGRNRQINIKATSETINRLYQLADHRGIPLGALLEEALDALALKNPT